MHRGLEVEILSLFIFQPSDVISYQGVSYMFDVTAFPRTDVWWQDINFIYIPVFLNLEPLLFIRGCDCLSPCQQCEVYKKKYTAEAKALSSRQEAGSHC